MQRSDETARRLFSEVCQSGSVRTVLITFLAGLFIGGLAVFFFLKPPLPTAKPLTPPPQAKTPFETIASHIDDGGEFYLIVNPGDILRRGALKLMRMADEAAEGTPHATKVSEMLERLHLFMDKNGFYAADGMGMSIVADGRGMYGEKIFFKRDAAAAETPLWRAMVGGKPRRLKAMDMLPADTVLARTWTAEPARLWELIRTAVREVAPPEAAAAFEQHLAISALMLGAMPDSIAGSFGDEGFVSVQLNPNNQMALPDTTPSTWLPSPTLLIGLAVTNNTLRHLIESRMPDAAASEVGGVKMLTISVPAELPFKVETTVAFPDGYILLGSTAEVVAHSLAARNGGGLAASAEFNELYFGLPAENNGMFYLSPRFVEFMFQVQAALMNEPTAAAMPNQARKAQAILQSLTQGRKHQAALVIRNLNDGILIDGRSSSGSGELLASAAAFPVGIMAAIAVPSFMNARVKSQKNACLNNLRMIEAAKDQYALENGKTNGWRWTSDEQAFKDLVGSGHGYMKAFPRCPSSGSGAMSRTAAEAASDYKVNSIGANAECKRDPINHRLSY